MDWNTPGFPALHYILELAQIHIHWVGDAIQPSHSLWPPYSSCLQSFPASGSFPGKNTEVGYWAWKNQCFWSVVLEKTPESLLNSKEIKPVNPKGNQPWILPGSTDSEAEAPILWPPDAKSQLIGKDPDAGKDWRQKEKGATEDEMEREHHWLNGHEFEQTPGDSEG